MMRVCANARVFACLSAAISPVHCTLIVCTGLHHNCLSHMWVCDCAGRAPYFKLGVYDPSGNTAALKVQWRNFQSAFGAVSVAEKPFKTDDENDDAASPPHSSPAPPISVSIDTAATPLATLSAMMVGTGAEFLNHEIVGGLSSQLLFGESFEEPPHNTSLYNESRGHPQLGCPNVAPTSTVNLSAMWAPLLATAPAGSSIALLHGGRPEAAFNGAQAQRLTLSGAGAVGIVNSGLNCKLGLWFNAQQPYDAAVYLRRAGTSSAAAPLDVRLRLHVGGTVTAEQSVSVASTEWERVNVTLTPNSSSTCGATAEPYPGAMGPNAVRCDGAFSLSLVSAGTLDVDMVTMRAAPNSTADPPLRDVRGAILPVRASVAHQAWGHGAATALRFGGSMVSRHGYRWKDFIGQYEHRQPFVGDWYSLPECSTGEYHRNECAIQSRGVGMFEFVDVAEALGVTPVVTFCLNETAEDMADLVEFIAGDAGRCSL